MFHIGRLLSALVLTLGLTLAATAYAAQSAVTALDPLAAAVARASPAVVRIVVSRTPDTIGPVAANMSLSRAADAGEGQPRIIGSGFIIDPAGFVATNRHVVEKALSILVIDANGERFPAKLVGMTAKADMALLHIDAGRKLPSLRFGDSDSMHVGDAVIAIGSPFGFDTTVTSGIISAVNRDIMESPFDDYFQTDAAINHGNSGGPLLNPHGEVIGMNSVIVAPGTGFAGLAFSIPSNDLKFVFERLMRTGHIDCGMLPIFTQQIDWALKQALGVSDPHGALVSAVNDPDGSMLHGQVKPGDIVLSFNGEPVADPRALAKKAAWTAIGSDAVLELARGGEIHSVHVTIHAWPQEAMAAEIPSSPSLGLRFGSSDGVNGATGAVVESVDPRGTAADSGIQVGDVVVQVQHVAVSAPDQASDLIKQATSAKRPYSAVLVKRDGRLTWLAIGLPVAR